MRTLNETLASSRTQTTNFTSAVLDVRHIAVISVMLIAVGATTAGTITVQGSCQDPAVGEPSDWVNLATGTTISAAGNTLLNFADLGVSYVRVTWTATTGTGTYSIHLNGKGV